MSEHITEALQGDLDYVIEGDVVDESQEELRQREIERYDSFATAMQRIGVVGIWGQKPLMDGGEVKKVLPNIPQGPVFRDIMEEQENWMTLHPCAGPQHGVGVRQNRRGQAKQKKTGDQGGPGFHGSSLLLVVHGDSCGFSQ